MFCEKLFVNIISGINWYMYVTCSKLRFSELYNCECVTKDLFPVFWVEFRDLYVRFQVRLHIFVFTGHSIHNLASSIVGLILYPSISTSSFIESFEIKHNNFSLFGHDESWRKIANNSSGIKVEKHDLFDEIMTFQRSRLRNHSVSNQLWFLTVAMKSREFRCRWKSRVGR